jgi:hypothetical protein
MRRAPKWVTIAALATSGTLFQFNCVPVVVDGTLGTLDFCTILNCEGSTFFDFCGGPNPLLVDCPNFMADEDG